MLKSWFYFKLYVVSFFLTCLSFWMNVHAIAMALLYFFSLLGFLSCAHCSLLWWVELSFSCFLLLEWTPVSWQWCNRCHCATLSFLFYSLAFQSDMLCISFVSNTIMIYRCWDLFLDHGCLLKFTLSYNYSSYV